MNPIGKYINNKLSLCHKPSFAIIVLANSGLSDITNNTKKKKDIIKDIIAIIPDILSLFLKDKIEKSSGTNKKTINPITEPTPCIFEAVVTRSFVSLTLKKQVKMQAPTANTIIKIMTIFVIILEI